MKNRYGHGTIREATDNGNVELEITTSATSTFPLATLRLLSGQAEDMWVQIIALILVIADLTAAGVDIDGVSYGRLCK